MLTNAKLSKQINCSCTQHLYIQRCPISIWQARSHRRDKATTSRPPGPLAEPHTHAHPRGPSSAPGRRPAGRPSGRWHEIASRACMRSDLAGARGAPAGAVVWSPSSGGRQSWGRAKSPGGRVISGAARWRLPRVRASRGEGPAGPGEHGVRRRRGQVGRACFQTVLGSRASRTAGNCPVALPPRAVRSVASCSRTWTARDLRAPTYLRATRVVSDVHACPASWLRTPCRERPAGCSHSAPADSNAARTVYYFVFRGINCKGLATCLFGVSLEAGSRRNRIM